MTILRGICTAGLFCWGFSITAAYAIEFPGPNPGTANANLVGERLLMQNAVLAAKWELRADRFELVEVADRISDTAIRPRGRHEPFVVRLQGGQSIKASDFRRTGKPTLERIEPEVDAVRLSHRFAGWHASVSLVSRDGGIHAMWRAVLRDGSNYVRQELTLTAGDGDIPVEEVSVLEIDVPHARKVGNVDGSPVVAGNCFFACEHPMANNRVEEGTIVCSVPRFQPVRPNEPFTVSSVIGVTPAGQLRRAFLYYVDRERARPYSPFVYYISWFDIAAQDRKMNEGLCLDRIEAYGRELTRKRGVTLDAFVFDDGWDDNRTLWGFHSAFPTGFTPLRSAAGRYDAIVGTWISPWGGYSRAKAERLEYGKTQGFETNRHGFSLGGPKYYERFRAVCTEMIRKYGVGYFKFDGVGPGDVSTGAGVEYGPDIEALLRLIDDLRKARPDVFVNTTVGTWPSPFWLWHGDSIWRSGRDVGYAGVGSTRQRWLTYRDGIGYQLRTKRGPLYPLNSLKFQSVMCAPLSLAADLSNDPKDLLDDIHMAAASGTQMQEFFVTPAMLTPELWDAMAETIGWVRRNADVLVDTHGIGGDPAKGEIYGYASWSPSKGIITLRNPADEPASFSIDIQDAFELPDGALGRYAVESRWKEPSSDAPDILAAGQPHTLRLAPFEVMVLEATPDD
ncbi:MAG: enterotoxin [Planctomycetes bacterium]|nr:enterotoxin [Planctomycetota bacterium]MBL7039367.1 enterotoxin [Pirellulaceae bacterium]